MKWGKMNQVEYIVKMLESYEQNGDILSDPLPISNPNDIIINNARRLKRKAVLFAPLSTPELQATIQGLNDILEDYHKGGDIKDANSAFDKFRVPIGKYLNNQTVIPDNLVNPIAGGWNASETKTIDQMIKEHLA